ncbi:hypothetical protein EVJ58_g2475 [Rhodofomes roseus]|uniref:Flavin reductase like domain-containing protein n=1 Tax=Rhodofomes roseus TaxID=34475 RepID=A0A4Y9YQ17_9APHY|nr:hypothetical protein EVJ58_g2475 [Rhodofomes roseus]
MPAASSSAPKTTSSPHSRFHGATLSSFTSIALDPHPLVAFSLRIPSRMATSLSSAHASPPSPNSHPTPTPPTNAAPAYASPHLPAQLVINILSAAQPAVAARFARPDLHADPFAHTPYALSTEGLPRPRRRARRALVPARRRELAAARPRVAAGARERGTGMGGRRRRE